MGVSTENGGPVPNKMKMNNESKDTELPIRNTSNSNYNAKGLSVWHTMLFIVGEVAGSGVLVLPNAILGTGWIGILMLVYFCIIAGYSGIILGKCWIIVEERCPKYAGHIRNPYQIIAMEAYGVRVARFVNAVMIFTMFGGGVVFSVLIASVLTELFASIWNVSICYWAMIVILIWIPMSWFGTPKDFWAIGATATITIAVAAILLLVQCFRDIGVHDVHYPDPKFKGFSLAFGAIFFGFGGSVTFPTIQNDMKDRTKFPLAATAGFAVILSIYAPVAFIGYWVFGNFLQPNLAMTVSAGPLRVATLILLTIHLMCAAMIGMNPLLQELERLVVVGEEFGWRRCAFRTCVMFVILFVGQSVPSFGKVLDLMGGSTNTLLLFVFPALFYMKLASVKDPAWKTREIPLHEKVLMWEIICVSIIGGVSSTVFAAWAIATPDAFSRPCYA